MLVHLETGDYRVVVDAYVENSPVGVQKG